LSGSSRPGRPQTTTGCCSPAGQLPSRPPPAPPRQRRDEARGLLPAQRLYLLDLDGRRGFHRPFERAARCDGRAVRSRSPCVAVSADSRASVRLPEWISTYPSARSEGPPRFQKVHDNGPASEPDANEPSSGRLPGRIRPPLPRRDRIGP
jgi:hypothetical protein